MVEFGSQVVGCGPGHQRLLRRTPAQRLVSLRMAVPFLLDMRNMFETRIGIYSV